MHVSTDFIFDGSRGPLDETEKPAPVNYYGESKLAAEERRYKQHDRLEHSAYGTVYTALRAT